MNCAWQADFPPFSGFSANLEADPSKYELSEAFEWVWSNCSSRAGEVKNRRLGAWKQKFLKYYSHQLSIA